jgi:hypothetical protein
VSAFFTKKSDGCVHAILEDVVMKSIIGYEENGALFFLHESILQHDGKLLNGAEKLK